MKFVTADTRLLTLMLVIGAIGGTFAIVQGLNLDNDYKSPSTAGAMLTGNVKVTQFGPDGSVLAYRQTDNHIVLQGMEIIMSQVFGNMNTSKTDPGGMYPRFYELTGTHPVRFMQIGTGGEFRLLHNDTNIQNDIIVGPGFCGRHLAAITNQTGDGPAHKYRTSSGSACTDAIGDECSAQMNVTATAQFLGGAPDNCAIASIDEAGIFDNSTSFADGDTFDGGLMFARNNFGSVDLGPLDTLQLDWEFTFTDS